MITQVGQIFCFLPTAVPLTLAVALHGVSISTVAVQVKLNEPSSLNVTVLPSVTVPSLSVNEYVDKVESELQASTSPTAIVPPPDGVIFTAGGQSVQKHAYNSQQDHLRQINSLTN